LKYIQTNFLNRQEAYINKPFKVFLSDLGIPVKTFVAGTSGKRMTLSPHVRLELFTYQQMKSKIQHHINPIQLLVIWVTPLEDTYAVQFKSQGIWTTDVEQYFADKTIAGIDIIKYI
jgi:hypothetical protein